MSSHKGPVCVHVHVRVCVCEMECVWKRSLRPSQCSIVLRIPTVIYVKIPAFPPSHCRLCSSPFSFSNVDSSHLAPFILLYPLLSRSRLCFALSPSITPLPPSASFLASLPPSPPSRIDLRCFHQHLAVPSSLCCLPCIPFSRLILTLCLVSCPPCLVVLAPQVVKLEGGVLPTYFTAAKPESVSFLSSLYWL